MKLSTRCRYGTRALLELAAVKDTVLSSTEIAVRQGLNHSYLENILTELKEKGLVEATRGAKGGYRLTRPPDTITLYDVFLCLDEPTDLIECLHDAQGCQRERGCPTRPFWQRLQNEHRKLLSETTLASLLAPQEVST